VQKEKCKVQFGSNRGDLIHAADRTFALFPTASSAEFRLYRNTIRVNIYTSARSVYKDYILLIICPDIVALD
jgi:hypothetical protein